MKADYYYCILKANNDYDEQPLIIINIILRDYIIIILLAKVDNVNWQH